VGGVHTQGALIAIPLAIRASIADPSTNCFAIESLRILVRFARLSMRRVVFDVPEGGPEENRHDNKHFYRARPRRPLTRCLAGLCTFGVTSKSCFACATTRSSCLLHFRDENREDWVRIETGRSESQQLSRLQHGT
jgi:hypothetical protein